MIQQHFIKSLSQENLKHFAQANNFVSNKFEKFINNSDSLFLLLASFDGNSLLFSDYLLLNMRFSVLCGSMNCLHELFAVDIVVFIDTSVFINR